MNYFYFFFFLILSIVILVKPFTSLISNWVMQSKKLLITSLVTISIGVVCLYISLSNEFWYERVWLIVTFALGLALLIRGFVIMFFLEKIKKILPYFMRNYYKFSIPVSFALIYLSFLIVSTDYIGPQKDISSCESDKNIEVICDFSNPEDIVITPDKKFLLMSEFGGIGPYEEQKHGFFALLDLKTNEKIIPSITIADNSWGDSSCSRSNVDKYGPHGIDLVKRDDGRFQLGVISHYPNETIEMFELIKADESWSFVWRGCIDVPYKYYFNDISLKKDGSFFASHMYEREITLNEWLLASLLKRNTGYLVEWNNNLFKKVPETEGSGPNGIALDEKSNIIYINYNQGDKIVGFDLLKNKKIISTFIEAPDNPYIDNNFIWVTSLDFQPNDFGECEFKKSCSLPFSIYKLDKSDLSIIDKYSFDKTVFGLPTVAVPFEDKVYMGSFHSDRLGLFEIN